MVAIIERSTWDKVKEQYFAQDWKTVKELAERNGVDYKLLRNRIFEGWKDELQAMKDKVRQKTEEVKVDLVSDYLHRTYKRSLKYEKIIDKSQEMLSTDNSGTPLLDVDAIVAYSKAELNIHALAKSALRISDKLDVTTSGESLGSSFVSAIAKLREDKSRPKLTSADADAVLEAEIVD